MSNLITARVIYNAATGEYYGDNPPTVAINCLALSAWSPRFGYLKRNLGMGTAGGTIILYNPTFAQDANEDPEISLPNTLQGVFVQSEGQLLMIDAVSVQDVVDTCDACCDAAGNSVTPYYGSVIPAFISPTTAQYVIQREDDGTPAAIDIFSIDYMEQTVADPIHRSWGYGFSQYVIRCFGTPTLIGSDTLVSGPQ